MLVHAWRKHLREPWQCSRSSRRGTVYAPDREWAEMVITEMSMFPAGRFSDLTDSTSQGLKYLRDVGLAQSEEEQHEAETETVRRRRPLYPC
jgi:hypothetical protein